ncbi:MAG: cation:dicarboxylase symporter family transporter [Flavobacteriales bacterium]|nr:cation:dicarboxylase symporter family transporter [Flavobacteriales bacterium]
MIFKRNKNKKKQPKSLSSKILIGLVLGIFLGLFFGEYLSSLSIIGDAFIGLLQMTVLPYIMLSLMVNIGRLSVDKGMKMIKNGAIVLSLLLSTGVILVLLLPLVFPEWVSASFYATSYTSTPKEIDFLNLFIPSNPFAALSNNTVPSVVLFSILVGMGLIHVPGKEALLNGFDTLAKALNNVNKMIVKLTPYGVFAIAASTAGTMTMGEIGKLQAYVIVYSAASILLALIFLPLIISAFTPFKYKDIFRVTKDTLITIFATGKIIIVLPQLIENIQQLYIDYDLDDEDRLQSVEVLFPLAYPFPNLGTLVVFIFVPFAGWFVGNEIGFADYPTFVGSLLMSSFVAPVSGIPFMLEIMDIPGDIFNLFVVSSVYIDRVRVVLGTMHLIAFVLITGAMTYGLFKFNTRKFIIALSSTFIGAALLFIPVSIYLEYAFEGAYTKDRLIVDMDLLSYDVKSSLLENPKPIYPRLRKGKSRLERIKKRGRIRIGFYETSMPFAYFNIKGDIVGFDIDMANKLALDLGVSIEYIDISGHKYSADELLKKDYLDIIMSGTALTSSYAEGHIITNSYLDVSLALVTNNKVNVLSNFDETYNSLVNVFVLEENDYGDIFKSIFPQANVIEQDSVYNFFNGGYPEIDAMLTTAEAGASWTLLFPEYQVVNPFPEVVSLPLVYTIGGADKEFEAFINHWIELKKKDKTIFQLYGYWILGKDVKHNKPRWSIAHDVLHWID